jgi:hypothetical protein
LHSTLVNSISAMSSVVAVVEVERSITAFVKVSTMARHASNPCAGGSEKTSMAMLSNASGAILSWAGISPVDRCLDSLVPLHTTHDLM